jgi:hypothetical protein
MTSIGDFVESKACVSAFGYFVTGVLESKSQNATQAVFVFDE